MPLQPLILSSRSLPPNVRKASFWIAGGAIAVAIAGCWYVIKAILLAGYALNVDLQQETCLPWRVSMITPFEGGPLRRGDGVTFKTGGLPYLGEEAGKIVWGLPGDRIQVKDLELYVNGVHTAHLKICEKRRHTHYCRDRDYQIGEGRLFLMASHPFSFDSRYWDTVSQESVTGRLRPLSSLWGDVPSLPLMLPN